MKFVQKRQCPRSNDIFVTCIFRYNKKDLVHPETQNDVVNCLKTFTIAEKNQPGFSNVFVEEISYKLNNCFEI